MVTSNFKLRSFKLRIVALVLVAVAAVAAVRAENRQVLSEFVRHGRVYVAAATTHVPVQIPYQGLAQQCRSLEQKCK